jgi:deoxyribodipyrimidine photo-lyase
MTKNSLILFKQDLRIIDNPAFFEAVKNSQNLLPLFILDEVNCRKIGEASKWFLHFALESLAKELEENYSLKLITKKGDSLEILEKIFKSKKIDTIYFNKLIEPYEIKLQNQIVKLAKAHQIEVLFFKSQTLFDPSEIKNGSGNFYKVFTPFWKECLKNSQIISATLSKPDKKILRQLQHEKNDDLELLPKINWDENFKKIWQFNHQKLRQNFLNFLKEKLPNYKQARDFPALEGNSKLSPYLHFGMISPREVFNLATKFPESEGKKQFIAELCWREFSHHLLFHFPALGEKNFNAKFDKMPWFESEDFLQKWRKGQTGFPIVDAGMKELWATGYMHNRVRMIVASFLIKDFLIDWREGEKWFWNCLVDANLANNAASWQWCAGSGCDAAPYFRIFNPTTQSERFDPDGIYIKKWLPQLKNLPKEFIHEPSKADAKTLKSFGVELGKNYPKPVLEHKKAREMALIIYKNLG